jgi:uncharacterized phage-associated protein
MTSLTPNGLLDRDKIEQVILYFVHHVNNDMLGKTKLLKLIYYADFDHFERYDHPITGARYEKFQHGPVPTEVLGALDAMAERGDIDRSEEPCFDYVRIRYTPNIAVDRSAFTDEEWETLESVKNRFIEWTTHQIVTATHGEAPWIAVRMREDIPYELAYYRNTYGEMATGDEAEDGHSPLRSEDEVFATEYAMA